MNRSLKKVATELRPTKTAVPSARKGLTSLAGSTGGWHKSREGKQKRLHISGALEEGGMVANKKGVSFLRPLEEGGNLLSHKIAVPSA